MQSNDRIQLALYICLLVISSLW
ncbi:sortase B protein-sorting domain-containing protein [Dyadobacter jiangsuensis]